MNEEFKEKVGSFVLKLLYRSYNSLKPFFQTILSNKIWSRLKSILPSQTFQNNVDKVFVKEWQMARKNNPWQTDSKISQKGINLVGYLQVAKGISEAARNNILALKAAEIPYSVIDYDRAMPLYLKTESLPTSEHSKDFIYNTNLIHINPPQLPYLWERFRKSDLIGRYTIGVWYWELPNLPKDWQFAFDLVDEVWVATKFVFDSVSAKSPVPVTKIPPCIDLYCEQHTSRADFNLPSNCFLFLCAYDVLSIQARKNPQGAIEAFKRAFPATDSSVGLVIKINNAQQNLPEIKKLKDELKGYSNCFFIEKTLDKAQMNSLLSHIDVYISLHRSEGFGLIPAEAMYFGKPVVMTKWSGNVDFMTENNSCGVNYNLVHVGYNAGPYASDQLWADPDIDHAAGYLQRLHTDSTYYATLSREASKTIRTSFSPQFVGKAIRNRLVKLGLA
jgi:glycosyltransferase involved in cell wall biosynthesis